jgi:2,4'-dihydroxyacetophenone dioxygenase
MMNFETIGTTCIDDASTPWIPFEPYNEAVHIKYFKLDPVRGEVIALFKALAGAELPRHRHSGTKLVYTVHGNWKYKEYDWIAHTGSIVFETACSTHTPQMLPGEGVITLSITQGDLVFLDPRDNVLGVENWRTSMQRYLSHCFAADIMPRDLTSFAARAESWDLV